MAVYETVSITGGTVSQGDSLSAGVSPKSPAKGEDLTLHINSSGAFDFVFEGSLSGVNDWTVVGAGSAINGHSRHDFVAPRVFDTYRIRVTSAATGISVAGATLYLSAYGAS